MTILYHIMNSDKMPMTTYVYEGQKVIKALQQGIHPHLEMSDEEYKTLFPELNKGENENRIQTNN